ncbi:MAG: hypothetical protein FD173_620 [Gallionellaceae bacterium]|nr:MAG: hypothetical protein FD173_620 [Gallionellaceae bacterium]
MWNKRVSRMLVFAVCIPLQGYAEESKKIEDNSFLMEEAYNQEAGVVQHIQSYQYTQKTKDWVYTFTQEWPLRDQTHQLSYSIPVVHMADPLNSSGVGDIALNYRYQAIAKDEIALSPRLAVILPTGDYRKSHGTDAVGIQTNIPLSVTLSDTVVTHWNIGATYTSGSKEPGGAKANTTGFNYGASLIYLTSENFNLMLEAVGITSEAVQPDGSKRQENTAFINPGVRFASNYSSGLQIVPGISMPIGIGPSAGKRNIFLYLSFEHPFM